MSRIIEYSRVTALEGNSQCFVVDSTSDGTRSITLDYLAHNAVERFSRNNRYSRKSIYRYQNLGTNFTEEQNAALSGSSPSFNNLYIGSYWIINGRRYVIADFDYWLDKYDTLENNQSTNDHHVVLLPFWNIPNGKMNDAPTVEGGYLNSKMYTEYMSEVTARIEEDWGDHILTHRECFTNATTDGYPSAHVWVDSKYDLMNECMVYGHYVHAVNNGTISHDRITIDKAQLSIFRFYPSIIRSVNSSWLRDIVDSTHFALADARGLCASNGATALHTIRPVFAIKAT